MSSRVAKPSNNGSRIGANKGRSARAKRSKRHLTSAPELSGQHKDSAAKSRFPSLTHGRATVSESLIGAFEEQELEMQLPTKNLSNVPGLVKHIISCIEMCSDESYRESLFHWKFEMQRHQVVNGLMSYPVIEGCVRQLQGMQRFHGVVELAKAMLMINYSNADRPKKQVVPESGLDVISKMVRPPQLTILARLCASGYMELTPEQMMEDGNPQRDAVWGGKGQSLSLLCLIEFLIHRLRLHVTGEGRLDGHIYSNILSLLLDVWEVIARPELLTEIEDCRHVIVLADGLLTAWYERAWEPSTSRKGLMDKLQGVGIVGMLVYRLQAIHPSLANDAVFTNLASKHAALEKQMVMKLRRHETDSRSGASTASIYATPPRAEPSSGSRTARKNPKRDAFLPSVSRTAKKREDQKSERKLALIPQLGVACAALKQEHENGERAPKQEQRKASRTSGGRPSRTGVGTAPVAAEKSGSASRPMSNGPFGILEHSLESLGKFTRENKIYNLRKPAEAGAKDTHGDGRMRASTGSSAAGLSGGPPPGPRGQAEEKTSDISKYQADRLSRLQEMQRNDSMKMGLTPLGPLLAPAAAPGSSDTWIRRGSFQDGGVRAPPLLESHLQNHHVSGEDSLAVEGSAGLSQETSQGSVSGPVQPFVPKRTLTSAHHLLTLSSKPKVVHEPDTSLQVDGLASQQSLSQWFQTGQGIPAYMPIHTPPAPGALYSQARRASSDLYEPTEHLKNYSTETAPADKRRGAPYRSDSSSFPRAAELPAPTTQAARSRRQLDVWDTADFKGWDTADDSMTPAPVMRKSITDAPFELAAAV